MARFVWLFPLIASCAEVTVDTPPDRAPRSNVAFQDDGATSTHALFAKDAPGVQRLVGNRLGPLAETALDVEAATLAVDQTLTLATGTVRPDALPEALGQGAIPFVRASAALDVASDASAADLRPFVLRVPLPLENDAATPRPDPASGRLGWLALTGTTWRFELLTEGDLDGAVAVLKDASFGWHRVVVLSADAHDATVEGP